MDDVFDLENENIFADDGSDGEELPELGTYDGSVQTEAEAKRSGGSIPPSVKKLEFVKKIASGLGIPLPSGAENDYGICDKFIDEYRDEYYNTVPYDGPVTPPSEKKLKFARFVADKTGHPLPEEAVHSWRATDEFLNAHLEEFDALPPEPPSEKQMKFASLISEKLGIPLPEGIEGDKTIARDFIDKNASRLPPRESSGRGEPGRSGPSRGRGGAKRYPRR